MPTSAPNLEENSIHVETDSHNTMLSCFSDFSRLPPELQDEVWDYHLKNYGMRWLYFAVQGTLDTAETYSVYATNLLRESAGVIHELSRVNRRARAQSHRIFPHKLRFYSRRVVRTRGQVQIEDTGEKLHFHKQKNIIFFRYFTPNQQVNADSSASVITHRLGNLEFQAQNVAVEESYATNYGKHCAALLESLKELKTVFVGMITNSEEVFMNLCRQLLITSGTHYHICVVRDRNPAVYCWSAERCQSTILELFERFRSLCNIASKGNWELLPMAVFEGEAAIEWVARLADAKWLAREYGFHAYRERSNAKLTGSNTNTIFGPHCKVWLVHLLNGAAQEA